MLHKRAFTLPALSLATAVLLPGLPTTAATAADQQRAPAFHTEASALDLARSTGQPVQVNSETTEDTEVFANPDGTLTARITNQAVRVQRNGLWVPIDTGLKFDGAGTVRPTATVVDVTLSGGGTGPMVVLRDGTKQLALTWPGALPVPALDNDTATYPEVLPGVDLKLRVSTYGIAQVLVVKSAAG